MRNVCTALVHVLRDADSHDEWHRLKHIVRNSALTVQSERYMEAMPAHSVEHVVREYDYDGDSGERGRCRADELLQ